MERELTERRVCRAPGNKERGVSRELKLPIQNVIDVKFLGCEQTGRRKYCLVGSQQ